MKFKNELILILIASSFLFIVGCGTTNRLEKYHEYSEKCQKAFSNATDIFFNGNYEESKKLFLDYINLDTANFNCESYAFLAQSYNQLGMPDSGKIVYQHIIDKYNNKIQNNPEYSEAYKLTLNDLQKWYSIYPKFPNELKKENGFVTYDNPPIPIGGINAIIKNLIYPENSSGTILQGEVKIQTLIDEQGNAIKFKILKSMNKAYDNAAIDAIRKTKFEKPKAKGRPEKVWLVVPISFR